MIARYLKSRYLLGGRDLPELDCWGICRLARHELFGRPLLPLLADVTPSDTRAVARAATAVIGLHGFAAVQPRPGAISTGWLSRLCVHVGLLVMVDGHLRILETSSHYGPCLTPINRFEARFSRVVFYDDQDLPRPDAEPTS